MIQIVSAEFGNYIFCYKFLPRIEASISGFGPSLSIRKELVEPYRLTTLKGAAAHHVALDADSYGPSLLKIYVCRVENIPILMCLGIFSHARVSMV